MDDRVFFFEKAGVCELMDTVSEYITENEYTGNLYSAALVFEEVFMNVASYAYGTGSGPLLVRVVKNSDGTEMTFVDFGAPFDPTTYNGSAREVYPERGGKGIEILKNYSRGLSYARVGDANVLAVVV